MNGVGPTHRLEIWSVYRVEQRPAVMLCALVLMVLCSACASPLPPLGALGPSAALEPDEALLWEQAAREHRRLSASAHVLRDPVLDDYLTSIARHLMPPDLAEGGMAITVHVLANPSLNAFSLPNGAIYLHSGLLARLENEAQLALVLGHELGHIMHRHAIRYLRQERSKDLWRRVALVTAPLVLGPLLAPLGISVSGGAHPGVLFERPSVEELLHDDALDSAYDLATRPAASQRFDPATTLFTRLHPPLALLASVRRYNPNLAEEADRFAVAAMARAGYDPREAERTLRHLQTTAQALAAQEPFWWGQPSTLQGRRRRIHMALTALPSEALAEPPSPPNDLYQQHTRRLVRENARLELKAGREDEAIAQLRHVLRLQPQDAVAHYYLGRAYAAKASTPGELRQAAGAYAMATQLDARYAEAYRELALTYTKLGDAERASEAYQSYAALRGAGIDLSLSTLRVAINQALATAPLPRGVGPSPLAPSR
jgi:predicted Zn-dependent protease